MEYIRITKENIDKEHICCAMSGKQSLEKKEWLKERFEEGLVFYRSAERGKCFIEYIPGENAWVPIDANNCMYINCLWVAGSFKGHGYSTELLNYCIKDSKEKGGVEDSMASGANTGDYDDMVPKAVQIVIEMKSCSVSLLQRRLKLGYARAARVVDQLEELGVVGPYEGSKPRGVLMDMAQWEEKASTMGWANSSSLDEYPILEDTDLD